MLITSMLEDYNAWVLAWVAWLVIINTSCLFFLKHTEARWILAVMIVNVITLEIIHYFLGFERILGIGHVILWTPLVIYLYKRIPKFNRRTIYGAYLRILVVSMTLSLIIDYIDVVRYFVE